MVSKQNPDAGITQLWALHDPEGLILLEGRPAIYETFDGARRAAKRTCRPARVTLSLIERITIEGDRHLFTLDGPPDETEGIDID